MGEKRNRRNFDFSKSIDNRFDFTKDEPDIVENPQQPKDINTPDEPTKKPIRCSNTGRIVGGIAAATAILAGVYFFGIKGDDSIEDNAGATTEQMAQACETAKPDNAQPADAVEDVSPGEKTAVVDEAEASTSANETPPAGDDSNATTPAKADGKHAGKPSTNDTPADNPVQSTQPEHSHSVTTKASNTSTPVSGDVVENARRVIRGDFGNGQERKDKLGSAYAEIQSKVNEMYRQGLVH